MLRLESVDLDRIGGRTNSRHQQWANLEITLEETETGRMHGVDVRVIVPKRPDATMSELEEAARTGALAILEAALGSLKESNLAELKAQLDAAKTKADAEHEAKLDREWDSQFPGVPRPNLN